MTDLIFHLDPAVLVPPSEFNATEKCDYCNDGCVALAAEVDGRFMALSGLCKRTQCRVSGEKRESTMT